MPLKTFIHISDLHIDDTPLVRRSFPPKVLNQMRKLWWHHGWQGHDDFALARLSEFVDDLKEN